MEVVKNILFNIEIVLGGLLLIAIIAYAIWKLLNSLLKIRSTVIMYLQAKKNGFESWKSNNNIVIGKDGQIKYCGGQAMGLEKMEKTIESALKQVKQMKEAKETLDANKK